MENQFRACLIHEYRLKRGLSVENVGLAVGVSKGEISRFERGIRRISDDLFLKVISFLNIKIELNRSYFNELKEKFLLLIDSYYQIDLSAVDSYSQQIINSEDRYLMSDARYLYLVAKAFILVSKAKKYQVNSELDELFYTLNQEYVSSLLTPDFRGIMLMSFAIYLKKRKQYKNALDKIEKAILSFENREFKYGEALAKNEKLRILELMGNIDQASLLINELRSIFITFGNFRRVIYINNLEAFLYLTVDRYDLAETAFYQIRNDTLSIQAPILKEGTSDNLVWCKLNLKKFEEAIVIIENELQHDQSLSTNKIFLPYCYYRIGNKDKAEQVLGLFKSLSTDLEGSKILQIQEALIKGKHKTFLNAIEKLVKRLIDESDYSMAKFFMRMELDYLEIYTDTEYKRIIYTYKLINEIRCLCKD